MFHATTVLDADTILQACSVTIINGTVHWTLLKMHFFPVCRLRLPCPSSRVVCQRHLRHLTDHLRYVPCPTTFSISHTTWGMCDPHVLAAYRLELQLQSYSQLAQADRTAEHHKAHVMCWWLPVHIVEDTMNQMYTCTVMHSTSHNADHMQELYLSKQNVRRAGDTDTPAAHDHFSAR